MSLLSTTPPSTRGIQSSDPYQISGATGVTAPVQQAAPAVTSFGTDDGAADRADSRTQAFQTDQFNTNLGNAYAAGNLANAGTLTGLQLQYNLGLAQLQNYGQQYSNTVGSDEDTYNNAVASNNLNTLGNLAQQAAVPRDEAYTNNSYANDQARYGDQTTYINQQYGTAANDYNTQSLYDTQQGGLANQLQGLQTQGAANTQSDQDRQARYAAEANGGGTTQTSYGANVASDLANYTNAAGTAANTNQQTQSSLTKAQSDAQNTLTKSQQSLADQQSGLNHNLFQAGLDTTEKDAQLNDNLGQLKLTAAQYGVNANQLASQLNHTLTSLNLQNQMTAGQILTDLGSNNAKQKQLALNVFFQALANAQAQGG